MTKRLNVLFLPHPIKVSMFNPWGMDVVKAVSRNHDIHVLDYDKPLAAQFKGMDAVIDHGGSAGTREMVDAATDARLWQILGTGFDHFDLDYWKSKGIPVANCPGAFSAVALAESAIMFILMLTRRYPEARARLDEGELYEPMGLELEGLQLGIVGFGAQRHRVSAPRPAIRHGDRGHRHTGNQRRGTAGVRPLVCGNAG